MSLAAVPYPPRICARLIHSYTGCTCMYVGSVCITVRKSRAAWNMRHREILGSSLATCEHNSSVAQYFAWRLSELDKSFTTALWAGERESSLSCRIILPIVEWRTVFCDELLYRIRGPRSRMKFRVELDHIWMRIDMPVAGVCIATSSHGLFMNSTSR